MKMENGVWLFKIIFKILKLSEFLRIDSEMVPNHLPGKQQILWVTAVLESEDFEPSVTGL